MTLVVTVEEVARRLGLQQPLCESDRWIIEQSLVDAQSDLEAYLGQSVTPETYTETGQREHWNGWHLEHHPILSVTSITPELDGEGHQTGRYTVVYVAGLDALSDPEMEPIRRFIRTSAMFSPGVQALYRRLDPAGARKVTTLSVEGQSVTYTDTYAVDAQATQLGLPGALPSLVSCDRWRLAGRRVHVARTNLGEPWPYERYGHWWRW